MQSLPHLRVPCYKNSTVIGISCNGGQNVSLISSLILMKKVNKQCLLDTPAQ